MPMTLVPAKGSSLEKSVLRARAPVFLPAVEVVAAVVVSPGS
jgi:hypothetical protein